MLPAQRPQFSYELAMTTAAAGVILTAGSLRLTEIVAAPGPYFIRLRVVSEPEYQRAPPATYEGPEMKYRFGRALEKKYGIKVFGPRGF